MLGDSQKQDQKQSVNQEVNVHGQKDVIEISCAHYTDNKIQALEAHMDEQMRDWGNPADDDAIKLKELRKVSLLQHQGRVTKVFCSLLQDSTCKSPKNVGNRCYLLGPAPASASSSWSVSENDGLER
jgi:ElaB/YqjD/DUF883 family membrane-anchored ribosome-binding protein